MVKRIFSGLFLLLAVANLALSQGISTGRTQSGDIKKSLDQFNADVAAWNKRCKITKTEAEEAWCKKERARIDAKRAELVAAGALAK